MPFLRTIVLATILLIALSFVNAQENGNTTRMATAKVPARWIKPLPAGLCASAALGTYCHQSSPAIADIDGDGAADIVVATNNGHILAVSGTGQTLWDRDIAPLFGLSADQQSITSSPAIADINGDGRPEIVVGTGFETSACRPGGVVILQNDGQPFAGWPIQTQDNNIAPQGCADPVFGTPALGDLDNDGKLEIVVGSFDHRVYAWHHDGTLLPGFPAKSDLYVTMGWPNMRNTLGDTIWSSPALADLDGDGFLDIVIGSDEGMVDSTFGNDNWTCPYATPPGANKGYCGGTLYAYDRRGEFLPGYPKHILEVIQSSPAVVDVTPDGEPIVFVGTGSYYLNNSPDKPTYGQRLYGWSGDGAASPGWEDGRPTQSVLPGSPVIGDITGDSAPEIVISGLGGRLYAWHLDGTIVSGFPMFPLNFMGSTAPQDVGKSPVLGDYNGDGKMEIFLTVGWAVVIVDGNGRILTNTNVAADQSTPYYATNGLIQNNPALGDIDGDGELELVVQDSELTVWDMPAGAVKADWPMFKRDPLRTAAMVQKHMTIDPVEISLSASAGETQTQNQNVTVSVAGSTFQWEGNVVSANGVSLTETSGSGFGSAEVPLEIEWDASMGPGDYVLGLVEINVWGDNLRLDTPQQTIPVRLHLVRTSSKVFFPTVIGTP